MSNTRARWNIYNKSSENMSEVGDATVDVVVFAPPYNIDTPYTDVVGYDYKQFDEFKTFLQKIIKECVRVLKPGGVFINESADTIYSKGKMVALSGLIQKICIENGLNLHVRHINFINSKDGIELTDKEHDWTSDYYSEADAHSVNHQWLIFRKGATVFDASLGKIFYVNYPSDEEGHPCPFSFEHLDIFLGFAGFTPGKVVLEPFMGTARMGEAVVKRGGTYIGYELAERHFRTAQDKLNKI